MEETNELSELNDKFLNLIEEQNWTKIINKDKLINSENNIHINFDLSLNRRNTNFYNNNNNNNNKQENEISSQVSIGNKKLEM